jgi:hypothetical protein
MCYWNRAASSTSVDQNRIVSRSNRTIHAATMEPCVAELKSTLENVLH